MTMVTDEKKETQGNHQEGPVEESETKEAQKDDDSSESKQDETAETKESEKEEEDLNTKYMRLMADFQNYKRRSEKERAEIHAFANEKIVIQLLEVMDNFERALGHDVEESFKEGMVMIFEQLKNVLKQSGVEEIKAANETFDPKFHNAVMMEETDAVESGTVSEVLQKGYTLHGKVIRPAMVKVAK